MKISYFLFYESLEYSNASQKDCINVAHFLNIQCILYELLSELNQTKLLQAFYKFCLKHNPQIQSI